MAGGSYRMSHTSVEAPDSTLVEIVTDEGLSGWGETRPLGPVYQPHHALGARAGLDQIAPGLVGTDVSSPRSVARRMDAQLAGHNYVKAAVDIDRVPSYYSVIVGPPEESARIAEEKVDSGYRRSRSRSPAVTSPRTGICERFSFKVTRLGGLTKAAVARDLCALRSLPHTCDDAWGGDVIAAACVHLAATVEPRLLDGVWIAQDYIGHHYDPDHPVTVQNGEIAVPQGPGLGVRPRPELLTRQVATHGPWSTHTSATRSPTTRAGRLLRQGNGSVRGMDGAR